MSTPWTVALVSHPSCHAHDPGPGHPESAARLPALVEAIRRDGPLAAVLAPLQGAPAGEPDLLRVHSAGHLQRVRTAVEEARRTGAPAWLDDETAVSAGSWEAALAAAGCVATACEAVRQGRASAAFALSRPPGHHATRDRAMGFCLLNNVAVAIRRLQARGLARRVLVVDWDAHHGNGTQDLFQEDPSVYVLSLHLEGGFPGTGAARETGAGEGTGTTRNVPLPRGTSAAGYRRRYREALGGALAAFTPDLVVVSAGFDCLAGDPEGGLPLEPGDLHAMTRDLLARLPEGGRGRVVGALEGGYAVERIGAGLVAVLRALAGLPMPEGPGGAAA
jgi:acetoin utilization deacetylase AcuC-like enzyme